MCLKLDLFYQKEEGKKGWGDTIERGKELSLHSLPTRRSTVLTLHDMTIMGFWGSNDR